MDKRRFYTEWTSSFSTSMKIEMGSIMIKENVLEVKKMRLGWKYNTEYKKDGLLRRLLQVNNEE